MGLGLYIVKTILNNHKENITVTSEKASPSLFYPHPGITNFLTRDVFAVH